MAIDLHLRHPYTAGVRVIFIIFNARGKWQRKAEFRMNGKGGNIRASKERTKRGHVG
jgi:hypothetical protein